MLKNIIKLFIAFALLFGLLCLEAFFVMLLVNIVIYLFGGTIGLTFLQSLGVCAILHVLSAYFDKD